MFQGLIEWRDRRRYRARLTRNLRACFGPTPESGFQAMLRAYPGSFDAVTQLYAQVQKRIQTGEYSQTA